MGILRPAGREVTQARLFQVFSCASETCRGGFRRRRKNRAKMEGNTTHEDSEDHNISDSFEASALSEGFHASGSMDTTAEMSEDVTKSAAKSKLSSTINSTSTQDDPLEIDRNGSTENLIVTTANESRSFGEDEILNIPEPATSGQAIQDTSIGKTDCPSTWSTTPSVYGLLLTNLFVILMVFILPVICGIDEDNEGQSGKLVSLCKIDPFSILIYSHTFYWVCHLFADQYLKHHHRRARLLGYLEFYIKTKNLRRSPFYIISGGNAILLITSTALNDSCYPKENCPKWVNIELLRAIICLECLIVSFLWTKYIVAIKKFKKDNQRPDIYRDAFRRRVLNQGIDVSATSAEILNAQNTQHAFDEVDVMELQSELLVCLCPKIAQEPDLLRQILHREATGQNLPREDA